MRFVLAFITISIVLTVACAPSAETMRDVAVTCDKVTNENWYISEWDSSHPDAKEMCQKKILEHAANAGVFVPCTLGGVPFVCEQDGENVAVFDSMGRQIVVIRPADRQRVGDGLVLIQ
jgi:hypothetical protein